MSTPKPVLPPGLMPAPSQTPDKAMQSSHPPGVLPDVPPVIAQAQHVVPEQSAFEKQVNDSMVRLGDYFLDMVGKSMQDTQASLSAPNARQFVCKAEFATAMHARLHSSLRQIPFRLPLVTTMAGAILQPLYPEQGTTVVPAATARRKGSVTVSLLGQVNATNAIAFNTAIGKGHVERALEMRRERLRANMLQVAVVLGC